MFHFMTNIILIQYFMFISESLSDIEDLKCGAFLSSTICTLNCVNEQSSNSFTMNKSFDREYIMINATSSVLDIFFKEKKKKSKKLVAFHCDGETLLVEEGQEDSILQNNCSKNDSFINELRNISSSLKLTTLEMTKFQKPIFHLEDFVDLITLNIHDNSFESTVSKSIISLPSYLKRLSITNNDIEFFSRDFFSPMSSLTDLDLSGNKLEVINSEHFENMKGLKNLDVSKNSLDTNFFEALSPLSQLKTLNISGNKIDRIEFTGSGYISNLGMRRYYDFSDNFQMVVDEKLFENSKELRHLDLSNNKIDIICETAFFNIIELEYLNLSENDIISLFKYTFKYLFKLKLLNLSNNRLISIDQNHFMDLSSLISLNLSYNLISNLDNEIFRNMYNLREIIIKNNLIGFLDLSIVRYQKHIIFLDASQNRIFEVSNENSIDINVESLDFSENQIMNFASIWQLLPKLKSLKLDYNKINNLNFLKELECLTFLTHKIFLSLTHNSISDLSVPNCANESYDKTDCSSNVVSLVNIDISFNPLKCDCKIYPFYRYLKHCSNYFNFINLQNVKCKSPYFLEKYTFLKVPDDAFSCLFTENFPGQERGNIFGIKTAPCDCGIRVKDFKIFINCAKKSLNKVIEEPPLGTSILFFQQNKLKNLLSLNTKFWMSLTDVNVDDNEIGTLNDWIVPPKLYYLSLRGNRLKSLSTDLTKYVLSRDYFELFFGKNSRNCDCESKSVKKIIIKKPDFVKDIEDIRCDFEEENKVLSRRLTSVPDSILCAEQFASDFARTMQISIFSTLLFILIATIIAYIKLRFVIQSLLYIHCNKLCCFKSYDIDSEDKLFDAFVAYSSSDCQIVLDLLFELENKEPRFRLCIHERDWLPGQLIHENIASSVQNSKRTIIIMSDNFIASPWFKVELNAAMSKDQMNPFIVILADKSITLSKIDKHFRRVISKKTYLVWGEKWFWEKLRYAMPHKTSNELETPTTYPFKETQI